MRTLKTFYMYVQKLKGNKKLILGFTSKKKWTCTYPDPDSCPCYNVDTNSCIIMNRCSYRVTGTKLKLVKSKKIGK